MVQWTIGGRFRAVLALIILLSVMGGLTAWIAERHARQKQGESETNKELLLQCAERIRYSMLQTSDALRGVLLDPKSGVEKDRKMAADQDFDRAFKQIKSLIGLNPEFNKMVATVQESDETTLSVVENQTVSMAETNLPAAIQYYNTAYLPARQQQDAMVQEFIRKIKKAALKQRESRHYTEIVGIGFLVLLVLTSILLGRGMLHAIQKPLQQLVAMIRQMQTGDFTQRLTMQNRDEFGVLAEGLNQMADDLTGLIRQVQQSGIQVNGSATMIAATSSEQQSTAGQIATSTSEISVTAREIAATAQELMKTVNEAGLVAQTAAQLAVAGQKGMTSMENTLRQITEAAGGINARLTVLNEKASNISQVVTTITKVADQTNLLSLNAAIEAEKAGDLGSGFAVVASEIRRLADQTASATFDIEQMVKEIQSAASAGVMGMDKFMEEVRRGVQELYELSQQLTHIIQQVQALMPQFEMIQEGMKGQATGAQQINLVLHQLGEATRQTADSLKHSHLTIEQLNLAVKGLRQGVERFKLSSSV